MNTRLWVGACVFSMISAFAGIRLHTQADDGVRQIPDTVVDSSVSNSGPMMQAKLTASQRILEGLLNRDFKIITTSAEILVQLAAAAPKQGSDKRDDLIYEHFRTEFVRLSEELEVMAEDENLEGAAYVHQSLTATCISCHRHLRDRVNDIGQR